MYELRSVKVWVLNFSLISLYQLITDNYDCEYHYRVAIAYAL